MKSNEPRQPSGGMLVQCMVWIKLRLSFLGSLFTVLRNITNQTYVELCALVLACVPGYITNALVQKKHRIYITRIYPLTGAYICPCPLLQHLYSPVRLGKSHCESLLMDQQVKKYKDILQTRKHGQARHYISRQARIGQARHYINRSYLCV